MSEIIRVHDEYYIRATSPLADAQTRVLKQGETFAIFDLYGDVRRMGSGEQGIYHSGTRHLSRSFLTLGDQRPLLLGSSVTEDNVVFAVDMTNPDMRIGDAVVPRGALHVFRSVFLWNGSCHQRFRVFNYADVDLDLEIALSLETDFADIFEVRGVTRQQPADIHEPRIENGELVMAYDGLDGIQRRTLVSCSPEGAFEGQDVRFRIAVPSRHPREVFVNIACDVGEAHPRVEDYASAIVHEREALQRMAGRQTQIQSSNELFNGWVERSLADLRMMITNTEHGPFPHAGVPWFAAPFGRDAIITAYQLLWIDPSLARGVLAYLAATQSTEADPARVAEPGKIVHEQRTGELAAIGEVPFANYYGSVDATPLFVVLAGEYLRHTDDRDLLTSIWPNIEAALGWIDGPGDADGDGFIEYSSDERGLVQQGWKDSHDSVFHADGSIARPPIALCEVQAYVYWAKQNASHIARTLGMRGRAVQLEEQAVALKRAFEEAFWVEELGMYALALDGSKRPCAVRASNAGHCLATGIASPEHATSIGTALMSDAFFSGWGIRTLATSEVRYGPITYHNGSVWPHDNSLIAKGLADHGMKTSVHKVTEAFLDASNVLEFHRLPELYCGFPRRPGQGPIEYPLACAPQAWASGSVFLFLSASLGLEIDASQRRIVFNKPSLPPFLRELRIEGLRAGEGSADLTLHYHQDDDVGVNVTARAGDVEVVVVK